MPVSTPKGYPQGTEHIVKEQGKFKTQSFANVTLKGIRKAEKKVIFFLIIVEKMFPQIYIVLVSSSTRFSWILRVLV